jgi:hypothetical protein
MICEVAPALGLFSIPSPSLIACSTIIIFIFRHAENFQKMFFFLNEFFYKNIFFNENEASLGNFFLGDI